MTRRFALFCLTILTAGPTVAAPATSTPTRGILIEELASDYGSIRDNMVRAAEEMPEAEYAFKPSPDVRSFAQQIAHVADDQYNLCAPVKGETRKAAYQQIEMTLSTKAELVPALKAAFVYCDGVYAALSDADAATAAMGRNRSRFGMLNWNLWHTWEHYGNIVVYLRMKGLVPPSSQKTPAPTGK
jgi:uncharacterized damage-inducible protein DinB